MLPSTIKLSILDFSSGFTYKCLGIWWIVCLLLNVIIFQSLNLLAQKAELTSAILSFRKQDMLTSKNYILKAEQKINEGGVLKVKDLSKLYYHKGLVFFNIYYSNIDNIDILDNLTNLDISYESFKKDVYLESSSYRDKSLIEIKRCSQSFNEFESSENIRPDSIDEFNVLSLTSSIGEIP